MSLFQWDELGADCVGLSNLEGRQTAVNRLWHPVERTSSTPLLEQCWFERGVLQALAAGEVGSARRSTLLKER
jgi:hypothetical protein